MQSHNNGTLNSSTGENQPTGRLTTTDVKPRLSRQSSGIQSMSMRGTTLYNRRVSGRRVSFVNSRRKCRMMNSQFQLLQQQLQQGRSSLVSQLVEAGEEHSRAEEVKAESDDERDENEQQSDETEKVQEQQRLQQKQKKTVTTPLMTQSSRVLPTVHKHKMSALELLLAIERTGDRSLEFASPVDYDDDDNNSDDDTNNNPEDNDETNYERVTTGAYMNDHNEQLTVMSHMNNVMIRPANVNTDDTAISSKRSMKMTKSDSQTSFDGKSSYGSCHTTTTTNALHTEDWDVIHNQNKQGIINSLNDSGDASENRDGDDCSSSSSTASPEHQQHHVHIGKRRDLHLDIKRRKKMKREKTGFFKKLFLRNRKSPTIIYML